MCNFFHHAIDVYLCYESILAIFLLVWSFSCLLCLGMGFSNILWNVNPLCVATCQFLITVYICVFPFRSCTWFSPGWWRVCLAVWTASLQAGTCDSCIQGTMSTSLLWTFWTPGSWFVCITTAKCAFIVCWKNQIKHRSFSYLNFFSAGRWWSLCINFKQKSTNMKYLSIISR